MKRFNFVEAVIMCIIAGLIGMMVGSKTCTNEVTRKSMKQIEQLYDTIDSISDENLSLRIDLGRYEIIHSRLFRLHPEIEKEVTENLE